MTYGILNVIWANKIVEKPREKRNAMNRSIREIPVTISAFSIGMFVTPIINVRNLLLSACIPIAAAVPITVAIRAESRAMMSVVYKAFMICSLRNSSTYHFVVNPPHFERDLDALKESIIKVTIGA